MTCQVKCDDDHRVSKAVPLTMGQSWLWGCQIVDKYNYPNGLNG